MTVSLGYLPSLITVPNLIGYDLKEAIFILKKNNLNIGEITQFPDRSRPEGVVIWQEPPPESNPPESGCVNVRVSIQPIEKASDSL